jgi:hypothetical protein
MVRTHIQMRHFSYSYPTTGRGGFLHPTQEAGSVTQRIRAAVIGYNESLFLPFVATNETPFNFQWVNYERTRLEYGALLKRIATLYQTRFGSHQ